MTGLSSLEPPCKCARTACPDPHEWWQHTDHEARLYCGRCAAKINRYYRDTHPDATGDLVALVTPETARPVQYYGK